MLGSARSRVLGLRWIFVWLWREREGRERRCMYEGGGFLGIRKRSCVATTNEMNVGGVGVRMR